MEETQTATVAEARVSAPVDRHHTGYLFKNKRPKSLDDKGKLKAGQPKFTGTIFLKFGSNKKLIGDVVTVTNGSTKWHAALFTPDPDRAVSGGSNPEYSIDVKPAPMRENGGKPMVISTGRNRGKLFRKTGSADNCVMSGYIFINNRKWDVKIYNVNPEEYKKNPKRVANCPVPDYSVSMYPLAMREDVTSS